MCGKMEAPQTVSFADVGVEKETEKKKLPMGASGCEMMMPHSP